MAVRSLGRTPWRTRASIVAGGIRTLPTSPPMPISTSPARRSLLPAANRAAMEPPSEAPTSTGGAAQVRSMSSPSQASVVAAPGGPASAREAPRPGRSGATTWCAPTSPAMTGTHMPAQPPCPCSSTTGGPFPPSSTAVDTPASSSRRSVTGAPASSRRRRSSAATRPPPPPSTIRCLLILTHSLTGLRGRRSPMNGVPRAPGRCCPGRGTTGRSRWRPRRCRRA